MYTTVNQSLTIKLGFKGVKTVWTCFRDVLSYALNEDSDQPLHCLHKT